MKPKPVNHQGLGYFNLARGLGIVLILLGHSAVPFMHAKAVSDVFVPFSGAGSVIGGGVLAMFFLISGFGFYTRSPKKCLQNQNRILLIPYFQVAAVMAVFRLLLALLRGRDVLSVAWSMLLTLGIGLNAENASALFGEPVRSVTILWFILALYGGWLIYNGICRIPDQKKRNLLIVSCVVLGWGLTCISKAWPMCANLALIAAGYLAGGDIIKHKELLSRPLPKKAWVFIAIVTVTSFAFGTVDVGAGIFQLGLIDIAATFCVGFLLLRLYSRFMDLDLTHPVIQLLERIGNRSIWIVLFHAIEKSVLPWYRLNSFIPQAWLCFLICFTMRSLILWGAYRAFNWLKRKFGSNRKRKFRITQ